MNTYQPIPNASRKSIPPRPDLHRHNLTHIHPTNRAPTQTEYHRDAEQEEHACNTKSMARGVGVDLAVHHGLADQCDCDAYRAPDERLASSNTVDQEDDEEEIRQRADAVVDPGDEKLAVVHYAEGFVHDRLVVADHVYIGIVSALRK